MLDHIGILVGDIARSVRSIEEHGWPVGDVEEFPSEGTRECYVGPPAASGRVLLLEAIGDGPYRDALARRGPGVHHIAIHVPDIAAFSDALSGTGWYLHPESLASFAGSKTIWLARPGVPTLIEVAESARSEGSDPEAFVSRIEVPLPDDKPLMADALGLGEALQRSADTDVYLTIRGVRRAVDGFIRIGG